MAPGRAHAGLVAVVAVVPLLVAYEAVGLRLSDDRAAETEPASADAEAAQASRERMSDGGRCVVCGRALPFTAPYGHGGRRTKTKYCLGCKQERRRENSRAAPKRRAVLLKKMPGEA